MDAPGRLDTILGLLARGTSRERILEAYPYLEAEDIDAALAYAAWRLEEREEALVPAPASCKSGGAMCCPRTSVRQWLPLESGADVAALRRFVGLTQTQFAQALGISVHTLRRWAQGQQTPDGPALALLRIAARHPRVIRENVESAA